MAKGLPARPHLPARQTLDPLSMSTVMSVQPLFTPLRMGDLDLPNRIVMAPLTRYALGRWITCAAIHCAKT